MAVRVKPVKVGEGGGRSGPENAVHYYRRDVDAKPRPAGSFLGAFIRHAGVDTFLCQSQDSRDYDDFVSRVARAYPEGKACLYVAPGDVAGFDKAPVLRIDDPRIAAFAWRRRTLGQRRYSIVGEVSGLGTHTEQQAITDLLTAPVQPWDALVFQSKTIKAAAENLIARQADYLKLRLGGEPAMPAQTFVIPPGINAARYAETAETRSTREGIRRRLGIRDDDMCVLTTGLFQFYRRAHPTPLYLALEAAARRTGVRLHILQAGWFDNEKIERAYREAVRDCAPAVNAIFLDGREQDIRDRVWFAADVYAALQDTVSGGVDTEMLEAMAAGLPVVASDWAGNRDIVRSGEDGYLVPTWLPLAESGGDLTLAPESALTGGIEDRADILLAGTVGQSTALDIRVAAEAFEALANDPDHRRALGASARARAMAQFDWPTVVRRHQALWSELRRLRGNGVETAPGSDGTPAVPHMDDPFSVFADYASAQIAERALVTLAPGIKRGEGLAARLDRLRGNPINDVAANTFLSPDEQVHILSHLSERDGIEVIRLAELIEEKRRFRLPRTLGWLAKMGLVRLAPSAAVDEEGAEKLPESGVSLIELGIAARRQGSMESAADYFRSALARNPDDASANVNLGEMFADAGELDRATPFFERAVAANPTAVEARLDLGKVLVLKGAHEAGIAALQQAIDLAPENDEAHYLLGVAYRRAGAAEDAMHALERCLKREPKRVDALVHLGLARKSAGRRAEALQAFRDALRWGAGNLAARAGEMSLAAERDGKKLAERDTSTRRVALLFKGAQQFDALAGVFAALKGVHWPLITEDGRELAEFQPDVVVVCGVQTPEVRSLLPNAMIISAPSFLASQNRFPRAFDGADFACAPSRTMADVWVSLGLIEASQVRVIGHLPMDPMFSDNVMPTPAPLRDAGATVLYAPSYRPNMSSVDMLGDDPVRMIRGRREDVTVVIKPHPEMFARRSQWIERWKHAAKMHDRVVLVDNADASILPYIGAADVLVGDVSSTIFDFLAVDRPILLLKNPAATRDTVGFDPQGIEWRWREVGREIANPDELARAVDLALKSPDAGVELRARYRAAVFGEMRDGQSAARLVELITELST